MSHFLKKINHTNGFELTIDTSIFEKDVILKAAYNFLDIGYFFFRYDKDKNIILECRAKEWVDYSTEKIIGEYSDELLATYLRDKLEKDNKVIREAIINKAIYWPFDAQNFVTLDTDNQQEINQNAFDDDIDEILKEVDQDSNLDIDENEIQKILDEIESSSEVVKPSIQIDTSSIQDIKQRFKKD